MHAKNIIVEGTRISCISEGSEDFLCLTDMLKAKDGDFFISDWLRNRNTLEFISVWECINNSDFNYGEFATIRNCAGLNSFKISVKEWIEKTNAIGIRAYAGRYGGTYAHKDIAFEFGMWISPKFKLYLIKEFQRLKDEERNKIESGWDVKRILAKINYRIHTEAVRDYLIPKEIKSKEIKYIYADEADVLNMALFNMTAEDWRKDNPNKTGNIRDDASVEQLVVLINLEVLNAQFISDGVPQAERLVKLNRISIAQMRSLTKNPTMKKLGDKTTT